MRRSLMMLIFVTCFNVDAATYEAFVTCKIDKSTTGCEIRSQHTRGQNNLKTGEKCWCNTESGPLAGKIMKIKEDIDLLKDCKRVIGFTIECPEGDYIFNTSQKIKSDDSARSKPKNVYPAPGIYGNGNYDDYRDVSK